MTATIDDVAQTLAEYERLAITSGARVQIDPPEYTADGVIWQPVWLSQEPPVAARATVHRDSIPTTVYAQWGESLPLETAQTNDGRLWRDIWLQKPMQRFGSFVVRQAISRAFREVIGDRHEPGDDAPKIADSAPWDPAPAERDWDAEMLTAADPEALTTLWGEMRGARARTGAREKVYRERLAEFGERIKSASAVQKGDVIGRIGRQPTDHLPAQNRADRRAKSRKKGRRR